MNDDKKNLNLPNSSGDNGAYRRPRPISSEPNEGAGVRDFRPKRMGGDFESRLENTRSSSSNKVNRAEEAAENFRKSAFSDKVTLNNSNKNIVDSSKSGLEQNQLDSKKISLSNKSKDELFRKVEEKLASQNDDSNLNKEDSSKVTKNNKIFASLFNKKKSRKKDDEEVDNISKKLSSDNNSESFSKSNGQRSKESPFADSLERNNKRKDEELNSLMTKAREAISHRQLNQNQIRKFSKSLRKKVHGKPTRPGSSKSLLSNIGGSILSLIKPLILLVILVIFFVGSIGVGALIANVALTEELPASLLLSKGGDQTSFVYDSQGNELAKLTGSQNIDREWIALSEVSSTAIVDAFISTEDERFEENIGISPRRIASAVVSALTNGGEARHGGSTITQQTVKLLTGEDQRSVQRKIQEWYRAIILTHQLSKSEIMELYLNLVPMANSYVGIQSAAKAYFGKTAPNLTLAECAYLAGIPKSPTSYNPRTERGRRNGLRRQRQVLANMYRLGRITKEEYRQALDEDLHFKKAEDTKSASDVNPYFVEYAVKRVKQDLINKLGYSEIAASRMVGGGGLRIHLTLDPEAQKILDEVYADHSNFETVPGMYDNQPERPNSGGVLINNDTHEIVAMQGGVGEKTQNLVLNRASDIKRQPGSTIKPVAVYGPAIDLGVAAGNTLFQDVPKALDPQRPNEIWPNNYDFNFRGNVLMRFAVKESLNTISVQTLSLVGVENAKAYLSNNGWDMTDDQSQLSLAVGAMTHGISPLELANSFATFASNGIYHEPIVYTRVEDSDGNIILDTPSDTVQVFKPSTAYAITSILQEVTRPRLANSPLYGTVAQYGSITNGQGIAIPTSVKTGTTENATDQWTVGYTPYYTMGIWYGFDNRVKTTYIPQVDAYKVVQVFYGIMNRLHQDKEVRNFEIPADTVGVDVSAYSGNRATQATYSSGAAYTEYFEEGSPLIPTSYDYYSYTKDDDKDNEAEEDTNTNNE